MGETLGKGSQATWKFFCGYTCMTGTLARKEHMRKPSGFIIYRGPSLLTGAPIVAVAITKSTNAKTGNMVQTYILVDNGRSPVDNARDLLDQAICGDCKHRRGTGGSCYVNLGQGPRAVADGVRRGIYPVGLQDAARESTGRMVRLGTYGDPAAVPVAVWESLLAGAAGHTGYTHQWGQVSGLEGMRLMALVMASADSLAERDQAKALGYRTFRVTAANDNKPLAGEFSCPASEEQGKRKTCAECGACNGGVNTRKADPVIVVHGSLKSRFIPLVAA